MTTPLTPEWAASRQIEPLDEERRGHSRDRWCVAGYWGQPLQPLLDGLMVGWRSGRRWILSSVVVYTRIATATQPEKEDQRRNEVPNTTEEGRKIGGEEEKHYAQRAEQFG